MRVIQMRQGGISENASQPHLDLFQRASELRRKLFRGFYRLWATPIIFTHAGPTMTPSASAPTCLACSGTPIPNPTPLAKTKHLFYNKQDF